MQKILWILLISFSLFGSNIADVEYDYLTMTAFLEEVKNAPKDDANSKLHETSHTDATNLMNEINGVDGRPVRLHIYMREEIDGNIEEWDSFQSSGDPDYLGREYANRLQQALVETGNWSDIRDGNIGLTIVYQNLIFSEEFEDVFSSTSNMAKIGINEIIEKMASRYVEEGHKYAKFVEDKSEIANLIDYVSLGVIKHRKYGWVHMNFIFDNEHNYKLASGE